MEEIINILMRRDGMTRNEAELLIDEVSEEMVAAFYTGDYQEAEDIIASMLGLEPDYLDYFLMQVKYYGR